MYCFDVCTQDTLPQTEGPHAKRLIRLFGMRDVYRRRDNSRQRFVLDVRPGEIVYITGACGTGKTTLLNALYAQSPAGQRLRLEEIELERGRTVIDCIAQSPLCANRLSDALTALSRVCISDVFTMLQEPCRLSEGFKYRYRLARLLAGDRTLIFADEFTSSMDRITARAIACQIRRTAARSGKCFFLASCHEDILSDLRPEVLMILHGSGRHEVLCDGHAGRAFATPLFDLLPPLPPAA